MKNFAKSLFFIILLFSSAAIAEIGKSEQQIIQQADKLIEEAEEDWIAGNSATAMGKLRKAAYMTEALDHYIKIMANTAMIDIYGTEFKLDKIDALITKYEPLAKKYHEEARASNNSDVRASLAYASLLRMKGNYYVLINKIDEGFASMEKALAIAREANEPEMTYLTAYTLGVFKLKREEPKAALEYLIIAEQELKKLGARGIERLHSMEHLIADIYIQEKNYKKSAEYITKISEYHEIIKDKDIDGHKTYAVYQQLIEDNYKLAVLYLQEDFRDLEKSEKHIKRSIELIDIYASKSWPRSNEINAYHFNAYRIASGVNIFKDDIEQAKLMLVKAGKLIEDFKFPKPDEVEAFNKLGNDMSNLGMSAEAIKYLQKSQDYYIQQNDKESQMKQLVIMGMSADSDEAINKYYFPALKIAHESKDEGKAATIENAIAYDMASLGRYKEALPYAQRSYEYYLKNQSNFAYSAVLDTIGYIYYGLQDYKKAEELILQAISEGNKSEAKSKESMAVNKHHLGLIYTKIGKKDEGCGKIKEAIAELKKLAAYKERRITEDSYIKNCN